MPRNFSLQVMTCPAGRQRAEKTRAIIDQLELTKNDLSQDPQHKGLWWNARQAWQRAGSKNYHLVLQDDVILCSDFIATVDDLLDQVQPLIIQLYHNKIKADDICVTKNSHWIKSTMVTTAQALILRSDLARKWVLWCERYIDQAYKYDDGRMMIYQSFTQIPAYFTFPNIVNHDDTLPSSIGLARGKRVSHTFAQNPVSIDWRSSFENPVKYSRSYGYVKDDISTYYRG